MVPNNRQKICAFLKANHKDSGDNYKQKVPNNSAKTLKQAEGAKLPAKNVPYKRVPNSKRMQITVHYHGKQTTSMKTPNNSAVPQ